VLKSVESKDSVNDIIEQTQRLMGEMTESEDTKELMTRGSQVWETIEGNDDFWDLITEGKSLMTTLKVGENESIFETKEVMQLRVKGDLSIHTTFPHHNGPLYSRYSLYSSL